MSNRWVALLLIPDSVLKVGVRESPRNGNLNQRQFLMRIIAKLAASMLFGVLVFSSPNWQLTSARRKSMFQAALNQLIAVPPTLVLSSCVLVPGD